MIDKTPTLCLNMIVKNESRIIKRLLTSVKDIIDSFCICDTGSTDNTVELIEQFGKENGIPGKIIKHPFRNFEYSRSHALRECDEIDADYILLLDADMIFKLNPKITPEGFKRLLFRDGAYFLFQGSDAMYYKNTRIVKNRAGFYYKGVTHEYVEVPSLYTQSIIVKDIAFIEDIGDGGAKSDKFSRDVRLLKEGLEQNPKNERYLFYLANSLKDLGNTQKYQTENQISQIDRIRNEMQNTFEKNHTMINILKNIEEQEKELRSNNEKIEKELKKEAIFYYEKRIQAEGFWEEVWYSYYVIGKLYFEFGEIEKGVHYLYKSFVLYPQRIENLYEIVKYYREIGQNEMAVHFYLMAKEAMIKFPSRDYLFIQRDVYDWKLDYEMTIIGFYTNPTSLDMSVLCTQVLSQKGIYDYSSKNILSNYKFYSDELSKYDTGSWNKGNFGSLAKSLGSTTLNIPSNKFPGFNPSTPTFCRNPKNTNELCVIQRYVDYKINDQGGYDQEEYIQTKNVIALISKNHENGEWFLKEESFLDYDFEHDNVYIGLEDIRLFSLGQDKIFYTANRGLSYGNMVIEHGWINQSTFKTEDSVFLKINNQRAVEKNWVMFSNDEKTIRMVYNWYPITLGTIVKDKFQTTHTIETPKLFKYFRGSTNGIIVDDEIWFLCHVVSYEDRRYYYHVMVMLDKDTLQFKNYTKLFTFKKEKVEYSLGMDLFDKEIYFGFSIMDRETHYLSVKKEWFEENKLLKTRV